MCQQFTESIIICQRSKIWMAPNLKIFISDVCLLLQINCLCKSVHQTLFQLSASHWIWSAMMLHYRHTRWTRWSRWSGTKMDRKWLFVKICICCRTPHFTLTHCCPLMLDSTSVRRMWLQDNIQEFSAWATYLAVSIHEVKNSLRKQGRWIYIHKLDWTF